MLTERKYNMLDMDEQERSYLDKIRLTEIIILLLRNCTDKSRCSDFTPAYHDLFSILGRMLDGTALYVEEHFSDL